MIPIEDCFRYQPDIKRLTKSNSFIHNGRVIYLVKKDHEGKAMKNHFVAYDYKTKIQLAFMTNKDKLIEFIEKQDLGVLDEIRIR